MIDWDWTFMGKVNAWQSVATIAVIIIALFVLTSMAMRFWPWLKKIIALVDSLGQLPAFIIRTDAAIADIHHEVKYNNGSSVKDAIARVELGVRSLHDIVDPAESPTRKTKEQS